MNRVILMGRLVRDPEVRYTKGENQMAIARYALAVDRKLKKEGEPSADFINCIALGKNGEFAEKYLHKGIKIVIEGRWQTGSYINKDNQKVYTNECVVESCEFAESKNAGQGESRPQGQGQQPSSSGEGWMNIPPGIGEELPFN